MRDLVRDAAEVQRVLDKGKWQYCFIGGLAVQKWGQVRITRHIDLALFTGLGPEELYIDDLLKTFRARVRHARKFAIENRVLLLHTPNGIDLDVSCGAFPFEASAVARAKKVQMIPGIRLKLCTAEDLIVYKGFANRPIDWLDIEGVIAKQSRAKLDWDYVWQYLKPLAAMKEEPEILQKLEALIRLP